MRDRVYGIATEYGLVYEAASAEAKPPTALSLFGLIEQALKKRFHTRPSCARGKRGLFLENGALVTFQATPDGVRGLLEMSMPDCSARDVSVYQSALDVLAADLGAAVTRTLRKGPHAGTVRLAKNTR